MSEYSESFHLHATSPEDAIALLRRAKVPGYVFPPENGFVTFVCPHDKALHQAVLAANTGRLLDYSFATDHGCRVDVYDRDAKVASLAVDFDDQSARFERTRFVALGLLGEDDAEVVAAWMRGSSDDEARIGRQAHVIARKLHLPYFAWLSYEYAQTDETPPEGRIEVNREGHARSVEDTERDDIDELLATLPPTRKPVAPLDGASGARDGATAEGVEPKKGARRRGPSKEAALRQAATTKATPKAAPKKLASSRAASKKAAPRKTAAKKSRR
jgi:hypothetical protein